MEKFKYLGSIMQKNRKIVKDATNRIRCGWMK